MSKYASRPIGEVIAKHVGGGTPSRQVSSYWKGTIPWASVKDFPEDASVIDDTEEHISSAGLGSSASSLIPAGVPLVCTRMAVGRAAMPAVPMAINQDVKALFPKDGVPSSYLLKLLRYIRQRAEDQSVGSTVKGIRVRDYLGIEVPIADDDARPIIAQILDTLDTAIAQTEAIIAKLKAVKQGLLHGLLTRGIDANGELRPPQSEAPQLYKQSSLGWIPREWDPVELNSLVDPKRPVVYGILMPGYGYPGGIPVIKVKDINGGHIQLDDLLLTSPKIDREYSRSKLVAGDLLFSIRGTVGRTAIVPKQLEGANITQDTARLAIKSSDARFVRYCLSMQVAGRFISVHTLGVAVQGMNLRDVRRIPLPKPKLDEAVEIANRIESITDRVEQERLKLEKLRLARSGLMDDLLTGSVRVTGLVK